MASSSGATADSDVPAAEYAPQPGGLHSQLARIRRPGPMVTIALAYVVVVAGFMIWRGVSVSPDWLLLIFVPIAILSGRLLGFLRDWVPFIAIFLGWEAMRGIVSLDGIAPQVASITHAEEWLFAGRDPTEVLQHAVSGSVLQALALAATVVYFCHFVVPLLVGLILWLKDRTQYLRFVTALLGMCFVSFVFFMLVPTAPPWYAAQHGYLPGVTDLISSSLPSYISPYYHLINPNPTAAFPSLHAAFPFLGWLAVRPVYPRASWILLGWSFLVFASVVFLGEHWVVDVISGVLLATGTWWVLMHVVVPHVGMLRSAQATLAPPAAAPRHAAPA
jgi:membrane-associated phospholipid phosphatase